MSNELNETLENETKVARSGGCGCGGHAHVGNGQGHAHKHGGCGGGNCGCGGRGKRRGMRTENTPAGAPEDRSEGRLQLGLRGK